MRWGTGTSLVQIMTCHLPTISFRLQCFKCKLNWSLFCIYVIAVIVVTLFRTKYMKTNIRNTITADNTHIVHMRSVSGWQKKKPRLIELAVPSYRISTNYDLWQSMEQTSRNRYLLSKVLRNVLVCMFPANGYHNSIGFCQERRNSIANALELRLSCTNPSICLAAIDLKLLLPQHDSNEEVGPNKALWLLPVTRVNPGRGVGFCAT